MNLHDCHGYGQSALTAIKAAISNNSATEVRDAFLMYRDCMMLALEHGYLNVSTKLSEDMYRAIKFDQLIPSRLSGVLASEVFSEILEHMTPAQTDMYAKRSSDEVHAELLTQYLKKNVVKPSYFMNLAQHFCVHGFPDSFSIALQALLQHEDQEDLLKSDSRCSLIWLLREYIMPESIYVDGEFHKAPKDFKRALPPRTLALLRKHHDVLAEAQKRLGSYAAKDSLPLEAIESFAQGLPERTVHILVSHHANNEPDPRFLVRVRDLGLPTYPCSNEKLIERVRTQALDEDRNKYSQLTWKRALCVLIESPEVSSEQLQSALTDEEAIYWRTGELIHALEASLKHIQYDEAGIHGASLAKVEILCHYVLEHEGHKAWVRKDLLKTPFLPKCVAFHPKLIAECLEIDLGL